ncbi:MAG: ABC transporter permease [Methanomassiliicoccaceae archaeon]|nr:ABC transporter permease [Methanomassiliicoccaceae archaeon]
MTSDDTVPVTDAPAASIPAASTPAASDDAPADKIYKLPSSAGQMATVFMTQMRLYAKGKLVWALIFFTMLIPILAYSGMAETILGFFGMLASTSYLLILLTILLPTIPATVAGKLMSSEFRNRTVYLIFPLPVSRTSFYIGKFLAALVLCVGIFSLAYGLAILAGSDLYGPSYPNDVLSSFIVVMAAVFAFTAMACGLSPYFKRGSAGLMIPLMTFLPIVLTLVLAVYVDAGSPLWDLKVLPPFSGYQALQMIDAGIGGALFGMVFEMIIGTYEMYAYLTASLVWGAAFLTLGLLRVRGKEL